MTIPPSTAGVLTGAGFVDHDELARLSGRCASGLAALGVGPGDTVPVLLRNEINLLVVTFAAAALGATPALLNWHAAADELAVLLRDSRATIVVGHADLVDAVRPRLPPDVAVISVPTPGDVADAYGIEPAVPSGDDIEWGTWMRGNRPRAVSLRGPRSLTYTSGTSGPPKAVRRLEPGPGRSGGSLTAAAERVFGLGPGARTVITGPLYHPAPHAYALTAIANGAFVVLPARFDPEELLALVAKYHITHLHMVPTMFVRLLQLDDHRRRRYDVSSLRHVVHAGAPCPPDVKRAMIAWWGPIVWEYYGCTETGAVTGCSSAEWLTHPGTVGRPLPGATVRVYDDEGQPLRAGAIGEIYARAAGVSDFTYEGRPEARREVERDGLITGGDLGFLDKDGYLHVLDRKDDLITTDGIDVYPAEIEACLIGMRGVRDCAVFGIPDAEHGEAIAAAVEVEPGTQLSAADIQRYVWFHLGTFKAPRVVTFHDALPREDSGKVVKRRLSAPHRDRSERRARAGA